MITVTHTITPAEEKPAGIQVVQKIVQISTYRTPQEQGYDFETEFFGSRNFHTDQERKDIKIRGSYYFIDNCREVVRNPNNIPTGWDPNHPSTPISIRLFDLVREAMTPKTRDGLGLYCALGTVLDYSFGTDGFFAYVYKGELVKAISFDLTVRGGSKKLEEKKAHFLLTKKVFDDYDPTNLNFLAALVAKTVNNRKIKTPGAIFPIFEEYNNSVILNAA